uniref:N-terminal Xaa-Pro-Lys N-methyltransferase 1 n=1 Tax=Myotis myotis TaxID=51298 RepID=A0A7J7UQM2_MYOMY|nr:N-terminal Xaa-Pro-Lys N-methyltransferase 1 [Myotis myotis]
MSNCRHTDPRRTGPAPQAARRRRRRHCGAAADAVGDSMASKVIEDEKQFYSKAKAYWKDVPPTVDGMLGGYGHISSIDINSSRKFLQRFLREGPNPTGTSCALDCGAGIGRITKRLLLPLFRAVDMVDVTEDFLAKAKTYLGEEGKRVRNYFCCGLQDFSPEPNSYDVIWIQWVIGEPPAAVFSVLRVPLPRLESPWPGAAAPAAPGGQRGFLQPPCPRTVGHATLKVHLSPGFINSAPAVTHWGGSFLLKKFKCPIN